MSAFACDRCGRGLLTDADVRYTVRSGDSLWLIARRFDVSIAALREWNGLARGQYLRPGQVLSIHAAAAAKAESI